MKKKQKEQAYAPIEFKRADPEALKNFDPSTKICTMNCGRHALDPRPPEECKFLCDDCLTCEPDHD